MKVILLLVSFTLLVTLTSADWPYHYDIKGEKAKPEDVNIHLVPKVVKVPKKIKQIINVKVETTTSVLVCIQERLQVTSGLTSCNPEGFFFFQVAHKNVTNKFQTFSTMMADPPTSTNNSDTSLRVDRDYWVSFQLVEIQGNETDWKFAIDITGELCNTPEDNTKYGPKCDDNDYKTVNDKDPKPFTVLKGAISYFFLATPTPATQIKNMELVISGATGNTSVYYRRGGFPTDKRYDAMIKDSNKTLTLSLPYPSKDEQFKHVLAIHNEGDADITVTINATSHFPVNGSNPEITDIDADALLKDPAKNYVDQKKTKDTKGEVNFFAYKRSGTENNIIVGIAGDDGDTPDIYVDTVGFPSPISYLISNTNKSEAVHLVSATADPKAGNWYTFNVGQNFLANYTWYIGVVATSDYTIFVGECARNCSEKGVCNKGTGVCFCDDGREGYDCGSRSFPILWIILIAIGSAIALAIAIAIPVTCYFRSRRNAGYERV
jgi:hypothetical protein